MIATPRRKRPFRPLLILVGGIAVLGAAIWVLLAMSLDANRLRDALQDAVLRSTGRALTVAGSAHLRLGAAPTFELDDVTLSNVEGGSQPNMLAAKSVRAELALLPLMVGDAVISTLTIVQPDITLEREADGTPNWQFAAPRRALYQGNAAQGAGSSGGGGRSAVAVQRIEVDGGRITWHPSQGAAVSVAIDRLTLSADSDDSPISLSLAGAYDGQAGAVPFTVTGSSGSLRRLQGGPQSALAGSWPLTLQAKSQDADLVLTGGVSHPDQFRGYQLRLTAHAGSLGVLNVFVAKPRLPPLSDVNLTALLSDNSEGAMRTSQLSLHTGVSDLGTYVPGLTVQQATLSAPGPGQLAQLNVVGSYAGQPLRVAAAAMQPDVLAEGAPLRLTLTAQAAGATVSAHGTVPSSLGGNGLDLEVDSQAPDLSTLSPLVGRTLPPAHDVSLTAQLGDAGVKLHGVAVRNLSVASSLGDLAGQFTVNWSPRPAFDGTLASRSLNLDAILAGSPGSLITTVWSPASAPAQPALADPQTVPPAGLLIPMLPGALPLAYLREHDANLSITAGQVTLGGQHYQDMEAHLELVDGKLAINPFRAQAPEGPIIGGASIDASSDQPPVAVSLRSPSISARALAGALGYPDQAGGTLQVDAQLSGIGQTADAIEATLNGHLGLALVNGQIDNALIQALIGAALDTAGVPSLGSGNSQVRCFAMRVDFAGGIGRVVALAADTSRLSLDGDGTVDLSGRSLDLHLRPQVKLGPTELSAPVSLQGPFGTVRAALDPVMSGGRVGLEIGGAAPSSGCIDKLAVARNGLGGPVPQALPPAPDSGFRLKIKKPKDLLQGLFH
jgi:AsmA protein